MGSSGTGETREDVVYKMAEDMLSKLPKNFIPYEVKGRLKLMGALKPMNIFLRQEIDRMQKVISLVRNTLQDLKLAIEGTIIMSENLRDALDCMYDARIPTQWLKISWPSSTLGFWFTELIDRHAQFDTWCFGGEPKSFWMTGFFNPQGFLTAMKQEVTRAHKGWALDSVVLHNDVTKFMSRDDVVNAPEEGVYVYGLYLEGAYYNVLIYKNNDGDDGGGKTLSSLPPPCGEVIDADDVTFPCGHMRSQLFTILRDGRIVVSLQCSIVVQALKSSSDVVGGVFGRSFGFVGGWPNGDGGP